MSDRPHQDVRIERRSGSLAEMVSESSGPTFRESFPPGTCARVLVLAGLFVWLNFWQFPILLERWTDPDWSHGFLIPLFSLYFLYSRRQELFEAHRRVCLWGLGIMVAGIGQVLVGVYPIQNQWISHMGMIPILIGLVLYLAGPATIRITWLPIAFLAFAMPMPGALYSRIALPLQNLAATASHVILRLCGVVVVVKQSALTLLSVTGVERALTVAEACSGMRMLMAFLALGVAMAYLDERPIWQRVVLVVMAIPIAILCNVMRVVITSAMYIWDRPVLGQKFMHSFTGMLMLVPALLMLWGLSRLLRSLFVEDEEDEEADQAEAGGGPAVVGGAEK
ncbi:MAG: exosortase/archaeosortase family protein [Phycisphaerae bacterium]